jgi:hypothetical protein
MPTKRVRANRTIIPVFFECGCCGHYHREEFWGDCRQDDERFTYDQLPRNAVVIDLECQLDVETEIETRP